MWNIKPDQLDRAVFWPSENCTLFEIPIIRIRTLDNAGLQICSVKKSFLVKYIRGFVATAV